MDAHVAARLFDEAIDLAEAEPGPLADFLGREERLEGAGGHLLGHAVAGVGDGDDDVAAGRDLRVESRIGFADQGLRSLYGQPAARRPGAARLEGEVADRRLPLVWDDLDPPKAGRRDNVLHVNLSHSPAP